MLQLCYAFLESQLGIKDIKILIKISTYIGEVNNMCCYIIPSTAALFHFIMRKRNPRWKADKHQLWLNQLLLGGAVFGIVDHAWNGELFLLGQKLLLDLALGAVITASIFVVWLVMVYLDKSPVKDISKNINKAMD